MEYLGNLILLIVGGNDTTRNSMSGSVYGSHLFPREWEKVRANRDLIPNAVSEIIRWQTPLAYMRRTALEDVDMHGKTIKAGDKVAMWYASGNRDERKFDDPDTLLFDRKNARNHISFFRLWDSPLLWQPPCRDATANSMGRNATTVFKN